MNYEISYIRKITLINPFHHSNKISINFKLKILMIFIEVILVYNIMKVSCVQHCIFTSEYTTACSAPKIYFPSITILKQSRTLWGLPRTDPTPPPSQPCPLPAFCW